MPAENIHSSDSIDWPPDPRSSPNDQRRLEQLLNQQLDEHWTAVCKCEGLSPDTQREQDARDAKRLALQAAQLGHIKPLQRLVEMAIGPDGKPLGKEISESYVRLPERTGGAKYNKNRWYEAMQNPRKKKLTEAAWEASRVREIFVIRYGHTPRGYDRRTDLKVAAKRNGVEPQELNDWKTNRNCPTDPWPINPPLFSTAANDCDGEI